MVGKRAENDTHKLTILTMIREQKEVLFGKFSSDMENQNKEKAWNEVLLKSQSIGICNGNRDWKFLRDKMYGVWKSRTLEKRDKARKTGEGGGTTVCLTAVDNLILDIIGKDSPTVEGINIPQTGVPSPITRHHEQTSESEEFVDEAVPVPSTSVSAVSSCAVKNNSLGRKQFCKNSRGDLLKRKRELQVKLLELEVYYKKLKCYSLERDLGLPHGSTATTATRSVSSSAILSKL
ncbi:unnamed protein product [Allacma fusca]|uniref:Regulatory protein zeste n=1 Tax=Allacma fusca TaxID=39272 RepID=A0A8J2KEP9_9HEXA|nr:unnamed protein product [Allacma fusca]